jgi:hypothetical protein
MVGHWLLRYNDTRLSIKLKLQVSDFMPGRRRGRPYANHSDPWRFEGSRVGSGSVPTGGDKPRPLNLLR